MAEVAEYELQEYVLGSPSYIRDTTDFINKLQEIDEPIPEGAFLFALMFANYIHLSLKRKA